MFGLFNRNSLSKLQSKYETLQKEAYDLSKTDQAASTGKQREAEEVFRQIAQLKQ